MADMYNKSWLSDVKLRVHNKNGQLRELSGHRIVLVTSSPYFRNMFKEDRFLEGKEGTKSIDLNDDDLHYLTIALRYIYEKAPYETTYLDNAADRLIHHIRIHQIADKYDIPSLRAECSNAFTRTALSMSDNWRFHHFTSATSSVASSAHSSEGKDEFTIEQVRDGLLTAIDEFYSNNAEKNTLLGRAIALAALQMRSRSHNKPLDDMIMKHPIFAVDWALEVSEGCWLLQ
ncbi:hypothetical protein BU16DRAFT_532393 [Lophium mytilinum]|uniref:BTB domain-containing protein n=1 Tax=Lophium mytilinum TaxID=390894 RepID=A0A6A6RB71_9PEZI|nr:hypothetical protein BU16DRAFT_532393 [Lophium mytilinum]